MTPDVNTIAALTAAAAQAAGPCADGDEDAWRERVDSRLAVLLGVASDAAADLSVLADAPKPEAWFTALIETVGVEDGTGRGVLGLRNRDGAHEEIRTPQLNTPLGRILHSRALGMTGHAAYIGRSNEKYSRNGEFGEIRVLVAVRDLGPHISAAAARKILEHDLGGDAVAAEAAWRAAGLPPVTGRTVTAAQLGEARSAAGAAGSA